MTPPLYDHQVVGIGALAKSPAFMLADEQGAGKTRQVIEAMQDLWGRGTINHAIIVCPASVRPVWYDQDLGQLAEYLRVPAVVGEYRPKSRYWEQGDPRNGGLAITVTNYEFIRRADRLDPLLEQADERSLLILDESSAVKTHNSLTTKACLKLRQKCGRVWLLNGTPVAENPGDLYAQCRIMGDEVIGCRNWWQFRARYAIMGGFKAKQVVAWTNLDDLTARMAPYVLRRLKKDCLDLPPKLPPVPVEVPLTTATWRLYKSMRDDTIAWLDEHHASVAPQAIVRIMRLSQLCSGLLGGVVNNARPEDDPEVKTVSQEKLEALLAWAGGQWEAEPNAKLLVFARFRKEVLALALRLSTRDPRVPFGLMIGGQKPAERKRSLALLHPDHAPKGPAIVVAIARTAATGINLAASHSVAYLSQCHSLFVRSQSEERVHRPGQASPVSYFDFVATGPDGQRTVDHAIAKALKRKFDTAAWTCGEWSTELRGEA